MIIGQRILARLPAVQLSQSELARRVGMSQGAMANLIAGRSRSSTYLHKIAQHLATTPAFLEGDTEDPGEGAMPLPPPGPIVVTMGVVLPPERALARMFEALLAGIDRKAPVDEQALLLARRLPIGLSQLRDLLPDGVSPPREPEAVTADAAIPAGPPPR